MQFHPRRARRPSHPSHPSRPSRPRRLLATLCGALVLLGALGATAPAAADEILDWNAALIDAVRTNRTNPPVMTRTMAMLNTAMYDAVVAVEGGFEPYLVTTSPAAGTDPAAAAVAAGHRVLVAVYPGMTSTFDALRDSHLDVLAAGPGRDAGVAWGIVVADEILAARADDGAGDTVDYSAPVGDFWWVPTPAGFAAALVPQWKELQPFTMTRGDQFRAAGPPVTPNDERYVRDFNEVKELGAVDSTVRTEDQSEIARFWDDGAGTSTPPGHWNFIASHLVEGEARSLLDNARLFAMLGLTLADAAIVAWDNKYHYNHWRPITAIPLAASDGNVYTEPDPDWFSYITTPPFPTYTSGHSTFSGAAGRILALALGSDDIPFSIGSDGVPDALRSFDTLSEAAEEAGQSRIYGGIHWQYDNRDAIAGGRALAEFVFGNFLRPLPLESEPCSAASTRLCLQNGRFAVTGDWRVGPDGPTGPTLATPRTEDSGELAFFTQGNLEVLVKVLDGCAVNGHWWVFTAGATDVEYVIRLEDTATGTVRTYFNPLFTPGRATRDVEAFPCGDGG